MKLCQKLVLFLLAFVTAAASAQHPFLIPGLEKGQYDVGYRTSWLLDTTRPYQLAIDSTVLVPKQARPILLNVWYPTEVTPGQKMPYSGYLNITTDNPDFASFSRALRDFNLDVIAEQLLDKRYTELEQNDLKTFNDLMGHHTSCIKNASPIKNQNWPLIIYHSGAQSSYEDNSVLCEFLASHGFVVMGSAFQSDDGSTLSVDSDEGSFKDFEFLIAHAKKINLANVEQLTLMGHSLGAQAILSYQATGRSTAQTIVLIDATFERHSIHFDDFWPDLPKLASKKNEFDNRLLGISTIASSFQLYEEYQKADRFYFSVDGLTHNEFIAQGIFRKDILSDSDKTDYESAAAKYAMISSVILSVLLKKAVDLEPLDKPGIIYEYLPPGQKVAYDPKKEKTPTPRQHFRFYKDAGSAAALTLLEEMKKKGIENPLFLADYGFAWIYDLLEHGHQNEAKKVMAFYQSFKNEEADAMKIFEAYIKVARIIDEQALLEDLEEKLEMLNK